MEKGIVIAALASGQGKTTLTTALLHHFRENVQPFKTGPDFIDPQFHRKITGVPSINLDSFMMNKHQLRWLWHRYATGKTAIVEGVMGFYDGEKRGTSTYDVARILELPVLLVMDGSGSYDTLVAVMRGMLAHHKNQTIKAVVFNRLGSASHYGLLRTRFESEFPDIHLCGWIPKNLTPLKSRHLGLDLNELSHKDLEQMSRDVLEHIDLEVLEKAMVFTPTKKVKSYPFESLKPEPKKSLAIVRDENFSFLYEDNVAFLSELFGTVSFISAVDDEAVPSDADALYLPGGYVETADSHERIKDSVRFRESLQHFKGKIYAECAGLIYLGNKIENDGIELPMSGLLDIDFAMQNRFKRMGYYLAEDHVKQQGYSGHAFHYSTVARADEGVWELRKPGSDRCEWAAWQRENVFGTYLHAFFRTQPKLVEKYFIDPLPNNQTTHP